MAIRRTLTRRPGINLPRGARAGWATALRDSRPRPRRRSGQRRRRRRGSRREALIRQTIGLIKAHDRRDRLSRLDIGRHVFHSFFGGSEALVRGKHRGDSPSFRKLAEPSSVPP